MKNEKLMIVTVCVVIGSGCLAFGLDTQSYETVDITEEAKVIETVKTVKSVKGNNPIEGTGIVIEVNESGLIFIDPSTGVIRFSHGNGLHGTIMPGDEITFIYIVTPNGNEIVQRINKKAH